MFLESMCYLGGTLSTEKHRFHKYHPFLPPANEVCEGYVFTRVCHSVRGGVSQHALQVSRPTPKGEVEGSGRGGACCGGVPTLGGVFPRWLLLRAVRILLECILVCVCVL